MSAYIELVLDIFDETGQQASVLKSLTIAELIEEIVSEFYELQAASPRAYGLSVGGDVNQLDLWKTLFEVGVQPGDSLTLGWARDRSQFKRQSVSNPDRASLIEESTRAEFPIRWQPAIVGRSDSDPTHNALLAANLEWLSRSHRVSRHHAQISERDGDYFLEGMVPKNPTFLNGDGLVAGQQRRLANGDHITLGFSGIDLLFVTR